MPELFDMLVYIDELLVKNLSSLVLTGYVETLTLTQSFDNTLAAGMCEGHRNESTDQDSMTRIEREGFKDRNRLESTNNFTNYHYDRQFDSKRCVREEQKIQTTYTTFVLNSNLMNYFNQHGNIRKSQIKDIEDDNINVGDIVEIEGTITNQGVIPYVNTLINLIEAFGVDYLDEMTKDCKCQLNFTRFYKMLIYLQSTLNMNNTQDLIMKDGDATIVLTVGLGNFMNNQANIFDKINCHCKVIGKVLKTCTEECDNISLLRKTGQEEFYESVFKSADCLLNCLKKNKIFVPRCPNLRIDKCAIHVMPINIYM